MIVDAHHHLWDGPLPWMTQPDFDLIRRAFSVDDLRREAASAGIDKTIVVQAVGDAEETKQLLRVAKASNGLIAGVVGWVNLEAPNVAEQIKSLQGSEGGEHLVGIRHQAQDESNPEWLLQPHVVRAIAAVADAGLVYDILVKGSSQLNAAQQLAQRVPSASLVLDHLGKPPITSGQVQPWMDQIARLADNENVVAKLSGLVTEANWHGWTPDQIAPYIDHALSTFGANRNMWGSDWPVCTLAGGYRSAYVLVHDASPAESHAMIFGGTASRIYPGIQLQSDIDTMDLNNSF